MSDGVRVALFFAALFAASAVNTAFLPLWFADRGLSAAAIGQILGFASLLRVFAGPSWGTLADRIGRRRPVMLAAGIAASAAALLYLPLHGFMPLLLVAAAQGIAGSALNPLIDSLALALARAQRMEYGPVRSIGSIAYMAASAGAGWLLSVTGTWLVPWLLAASYGSATAVTPFLPEAASRAVPRAFAGLRLLANRPFRLAVLASALIQGAHAAYYGFAPLYWRSQGMSDAVIGLLMAEAIVAEVALFAWGRAADRAARAGGAYRVRRRRIGAALERHRAGAAARGAGRGAVAACRHVRDAAPVGDAGAEPRRPAGTRRHRTGAAFGTGLWRARRTADAAGGVSLCALRRDGVPGDGGDRRQCARAGAAAGIGDAGTMMGFAVRSTHPTDHGMAARDTQIRNRMG